MLRLPWLLERLISYWILIAGNIVWHLRAVQEMVSNSERNDLPTGKSNTSLLVASLPVVLVSFHAIPIYFVL